MGGLACTGTKGRRVALNVLGSEPGRAPAIRASRMSRRRAVVLGIVQAVMIGHLVLWLLSVRFGWFGGRTLTPVEPSESQETMLTGTINAGFIFFVLAIASTLVLGRWFCGWGCHVVLLQDLCGWMMKKLGLRPRPFRSRLLVYGPLLMALYMFVWPVARRCIGWAAASLGYNGWAMPPWQAQLHLVDSGFWDTFPSPWVAVPFLLICGFATVYFLGAKGFCTYGCPYGAVFAPADRIAPGRIRVTDACEGCGHCTAVCTSNVRVHEEVRDYGMVVDPGCMKCLDCVSVCPNDALYFGFAQTSVPAKKPAQKPSRPFDLTRREELGLSALLLTLFLIYNRLYGQIPPLMAAGMAPITAFLFWKAWRVAREPNAALHQFRLKYRGRMTAAGRVFLAGTALVALFTAHSAIVRGLQIAADTVHDRVTLSLEEVLSPQRPQLDESAARSARQAIHLYGLTSRFGFVTPMRNHVRQARLHLCLGEYQAAMTPLSYALPAAGDTEAIYRMSVFTLSAVGRSDEALALGEHVLAGHPTFSALRRQSLRLAVATGLAAGQTGRLDDARRQLEQAVRIDGNSAATWGYLGVAQLKTDRTGDGVASLKRALAIEPQNVGLLRTLAWVLATCFDETLRDGPLAVQLSRQAEGLSAGRDALVQDTLAAALARQGNYEQAVQCLQQALSLTADPNLQAALAARADLYRAGRPFTQPAPR